MTEFQILQSKLKSITRYLLDFRVHAILKGSLLRVQFRVFLFLEKTCSHHPRKKYFKMFSSLFFFILCNGFYNCSFLHYPIQYELAKQQKTYTDALGSFDSCHDVPSLFDSFCSFTLPNVRQKSSVSVPLLQNSRLLYFH